MLLACWLHGSDERIAALHAEHDSDPNVELSEASRIGRRDRAPAVSTEAELRRTDVQRPNDPYDPDARDYRVLRAVLAGELDTGDLIAELKKSELRGMGGAGFPAGTKWELVAKQEAEPKYAICNADESEPGTFKDRQILAEQPHLVLEGLVLGMVATGCREGWSSSGTSTSGGGRAPRGARAASRAGLLERGRRHRGHLHLARRLHPG